MALENTPIAIHIDSAKEYFRLAKHFNNAMDDISEHFLKLAEEQVVMAEIYLPKSELKVEEADARRIWECRE